METIENIEKSVDRIIAIVSAQLDALREIKLLLSSETLKGINVNSNFLIHKLNSNAHKESRFNLDIYNGYPFDESFPKKMEFLDKIHQQAWRLKERRELIILIEGSERASITLEGITGKLQNLWKSGKWDGAKYGAVNKFTFYARKDWISPDGKSIKNEFAPPIEILSELNEEQRKPENIKWLRKYN